MGAALGLGLGPGDVVVSLGTSGTVFASARGTDGGPDRVRRRLRRRDRRPPPAGLHPQRRPGADRRRADARHRPRRPRPAGPRRRSPGRVGSPCCPTSTASAPPTCPTRPAPSAGSPGRTSTPDEPRPGRRRGHAVQPRRRASTRCATTASPSSACCSSVARRGPRPCRRWPSGIFGVAGVGAAPGEYVALGAARQAAWVLARSRGRRRRGAPGLGDRRAGGARPGRRLGRRGARRIHPSPRADARHLTGRARLTRSGVSGITRRGLGPRGCGCEDGRRSRTMSINPVEEEDA